VTSTADRNTLSAMARRRLAIVVASFALTLTGALFSCVGDNPGTAPESDASADGVGSADAGDASSASPDAEGGAHSGCDLAAPFGAPVPIAELNTTDDDSKATLTDDELLILFARGGTTGPVKLFSSVRASRNVAFGPVAEVTEITIGGDTTEPALSGDGKTLYYTAPQAGTSVDIFRASRNDRDSQWTGVEALSATAINSPKAEGYPFDTPDGLWFKANQVPEKANDILFAPRIGGVLTTAAVAPGVNSNNNDLSPVISADGLRIYLASDRADPSAKGGYEVWTATRASKTDAFGTPVLVPELGSAFTDVPRWISSDGCRLYMTSNRGVGDAGATDDIYLATKPALP
jgi:WD40 repeat protein